MDNTALKMLCMAEVVWAVWTQRPGDFYFFVLNQSSAEIGPTEQAVTL